MFRFENEYMLYALLLVPFLVFLYIYIRIKQNRNWSNYANMKLLRGMMLEKSPRMKTAKFIILCLAYIALIFSLANPELGSSVEKGKQKGIDIMFCMDVSNSMLAQDFSPNRLEASKRAMMSFLDRVKGDRVGLIVFAGKSFVQLPITSDYAAAKTFISQVSTQSVNEQGTDIGAAIDLAAASMLPQKNTEDILQASNNKVNKVIVVISDGEDHVEDAIEIAKVAAEKGIKIYTIGMGSSLGEPIPVKSLGGSMQYKKDKEGNTIITRLNEKILKDIASTGKGSYIHASNANVGFDALYNELNKIEKNEMEDVIYSKYITKFYFPLWIAFILLVLEVILYDKKVLRLSHFSWLNKRITTVLCLMLFSSFAVRAQTRDELKYLRQGNSDYYTGQKLDKKAAELNQKKGELYQNESAQTKQQAQQMYEKASTLYLKSNNSNSDYYKSFFNLGASLYKQGKYKDAASSFEKVASNTSLNKNVRAKAYHNLGNSLLQQKNYKESIDAYKNALKLNASDMDTKYNLEYAKRMLAVQQQQKQQQNKNKQNQQQQQQQKQQDNKNQNNNQQQQQQNKNQQNKDKQNQQQNQDQKKDAKRQLDALQQNERRTQEKVKEAEMQKTRKTHQEKDW